MHCRFFRICQEPRNECAHLSSNALALLWSRARQRWLSAAAATATIAAAAKPTTIAAAAATITKPTTIAIARPTDETASVSLVVAFQAVPETHDEQDDARYPEAGQRKPAVAHW
jgi:hypothetical protein